MGRLGEPRYTSNSVRTTDREVSNIARFNRAPRPEPGPEINQRVLKYRDVRVIGSEGQQLGIMQSRAALTQAREEGLDLVVVSPTANPPVCKIIDYGRHKYAESKLGKDKKSKQPEVKGIKVSPRIAEHDLGFLVKNAIRFIEDGHKVKVTCQFKAREVTHPELGRQKLELFAEEVKNYATVERTPVLDGKLMIMVLVPKPNLAGAKKNAKDQDQQNSGKAIQDNGNRENNATEVAQQPPVPAQESEPEATVGAGTNAV